MSQPIEWVTYSRKSNGRKAVPRQEALIGRMTTERGGTVLDRFSDRDSTAFAKPGAARPKRDDFDRMITLLENRKGLRIAAYHADRLLRNSEDTATLIRVCAAGGHLIETYAGGVYDLSTANGRRRLRDDASAAEFEVDHNTERILAAKDEAAASGRWLGGHRPFGWESDPNPAGDDGEPLLDEDGEPLKGILRLVPAEEDAIRQASADILAGASIRSIRLRWREAGITGTTGAFMVDSEVRRVLMRARNAGLMEHRGQVTGKASWPPIVDEPTWRAVCSILSDPARKTTPGPGRKHLLSGIATCGVCDAPLITTSTTQPVKRFVYRCRQVKRQPSGGHVARHADSLDSYVTALVLERLQRADAKKLLRREHVSKLPALYRRKASLEAAMQASNDLRKRGLLTPAEFAEDRKAHQAAMSALDEEIGRAEEADVLAPAVRDPLGTWETSDLDQKRAIVTALITIKVHPQAKGRPKGWTPGSPYFDPDTIEIGWKRDA